MKYLKYLVYVLVISSCSSIKVNYDYDKDIDFNAFRSYNYYANLETGMSELDTERLLILLDSALYAKGYKLSSEPDFYVDIQSSDFQKASNSSVGIGVGGTSGNVGGGMSVGIPLGQSQRTRIVQIEFVDEKGKGLFWQAICESNYNPNDLPEKREANLKSLVNKVFSAYPPNRK